MSWRKWNRWLHRELGYLFFGMTLVYAISGIALNHGVARHWNPGIISRSESYNYQAGYQQSDIQKKQVEEILELCDARDHFKNYYFPDEDHLMIYLRGGHITLRLSTGEVQLTRIRNRPVFREVNYLHYNKPKKLWTWFSDIFAFSLILLAISGLLLVRGKKGVRGRGGWLLAAGIAIPLIFLAFYLWW